VKALDAFGKDKIIIETVGAGQNEIDIVKSADTVAVLVPPGSGDDVQMLKAGILEIGDIFVVNKADLKGADRTVQELREMVHMQQDNTANLATGHHGAGAIPDEEEDGAGAIPDEEEDGADADEGDRDDDEPESWDPAIVETVAKDGEGVEELIETLEDHYEYLRSSGLLEDKARMRYAEEIRNLLRDDVGTLLEGEIERRGGMDELVSGIIDRETDPYTVADEVMDPIEDCVDELGDRDE
jgi:LAO/AO transport system kinase